MISVSGLNPLSRFGRPPRAAGSIGGACNAVSVMVIPSSHDRHSPAFCLRGCDGNHVVLPIERQRRLAEGEAVEVTSNSALQRVELLCGTCFQATLETVGMCPQ